MFAFSIKIENEKLPLGAVYRELFVSSEHTTRNNTKFAIPRQQRLRLVVSSSQKQPNQMWMKTKIEFIDQP